MCLWSIHPKYLDTKGLLAVWREGLLAKHVLEGNTKGYKNHPQLDRFKKSESLKAINIYLRYIWEESINRGYTFQKSKFLEFSDDLKIPVTEGQIQYEWDFLLSKLKNRDNGWYNRIKAVEIKEINPLFDLTSGGVEPWEKVKQF